MNAQSAAGRKTDRFEAAARRLEERMETQLELLTDAMRGSVTRADTVDGDDEYGHRRNSHIGEAVKIGAVSAQIVVALGKYAGEFNHNITVKRTGENAASVEPSKYQNRRRLTDEEWENSRTYCEVARSSSHPPLDRALKAYHAERDAELAAEAAAAANSTEGDPPPENCGSNG